jgi:hypothetical protein
VSSSEGRGEIGDLIVVLLAASLRGLSERLLHDGYEDAAELVADLIEVTDDYLARLLASSSVARYPAEQCAGAEWYSGTLVV